MLLGQLPTSFKQDPIVIVMGVSGCGKSTIAKAYASQNSLPFIEGDDYHPKSNIKKLTAGIALNDLDRWPWLEQLAQAVKQQASSHGGAVASCSALKKSYRDYLIKMIEQPLVFAYLHGNRELFVERVSARKNHIMPISLLDSQLHTLEKPNSHEPVVTLFAKDTIESTISLINEALRPLLVQK